MFWIVETKEITEAPGLRPANAGRFVLHRHTDAQGLHLDLRLECRDALLGWRIDGVALDDSAQWATEKMPHPKRWLDADGGATRLDAGTYAWKDWQPGKKVLRLHGEGRCLEVQVTEGPAIPAQAVRSLALALEKESLAFEEAGRLVQDGLTARRRTLARFCGLGRELDGDAFDEAVSRKALAGLSLDELHNQLRAYEVRFDRKYPPEPVSRPEPLEESSNRSQAALGILNDESRRL